MYFILLSVDDSRLNQSLSVEDQRDISPVCFLFPLIYQVEHTLFLYTVLARPYRRVTRNSDHNRRYFKRR